MGMSASQMRYCMLTGRKSDVEYQGQQINQQRTTLATETSAMNTQFLTLNVPTPPSSDQYTKTAYTFESNGETRTITGTVYDRTSGNYTVYYNTDTTTSKGKSSGTSTFSSALHNGQPPYLTSQGTTLTQVITDPAAPGYSATDISNIALICQDCGIPGTPAFYKYTSGSVTKYVLASELASHADTPTAISTYYVDENASETEHSQLNDCQVTWNDTGRMTSITDADGNVYTLSTTTVNDQSAYDDAFNEYEYQKAKYDKDMDNINAKICIIESQDKKLELKLKDLDTQQEALNTEMDSVKKVVDKNIEQSFKAFA